MINSLNKIINLIPLPREFTIYLIIGGFSALTYMICYNLSIYFIQCMDKITIATQQIDIISVCVGFTLSWMVSYMGNATFTFKVEDKANKIRIIKDIIRNITVFLSMQLITYLCNHVFGLSNIITSFISAASAPLISFPIMKFWVFKK